MARRLLTEEELSEELSDDLYSSEEDLHSDDRSDEEGWSDDWSDAEDEMSSDLTTSKEEDDKKGPQCQLLQLVKRKVKERRQLQVQSEIRKRRRLDDDFRSIISKETRELNDRIQSMHAVLTAFHAAHYPAEHAAHLQLMKLQEQQWSENMQAFIGVMDDRWSGRRSEDHTSDN